LRFEFHYIHQYVIFRTYTYRRLKKKSKCYKRCCRSNKRLYTSI